MRAKVLAQSFMDFATQEKGKVKMQDGKVLAVNGKELDDFNLNKSAIQSQYHERKGSAERCQHNSQDRQREHDSDQENRRRIASSVRSASSAA
jgi:hypothetical protein